MGPTHAGRDESEPEPERDSLSLERAVSVLFSPGKEDPLDQLLQLVGEGMAVSRTYLFRFRRDGRSMDNTHEWCAEGVEPQIDLLQDLPSDAFPWWMERLRAGEEVAAQSLEELPAEAAAEREILAQQGIHAFLVLPLRSESGELLGFMGFDDVSGPREWSRRERDSLASICRLGSRELERREAARALHRAQVRLARTERIARVGGWELEPENGDAWWSPQARELLGIPVEQGPATLFDFFQRIHPEDRDRVRTIALKILDDGRPFRCECRVMGRPEEGLRHIEIQGALRSRSRGRDIVVGTLQDVTDRRLLEAQLRETQRMDAVGRLAGGVAHDFNNFLSVILGGAGLLLGEWDESDPRRSDLAQIQQAAIGARDLTRQLMAFGRRQMLEPRPLDVSEVVRDSSKLLRGVLPEDVRLVIEADGDAGMVQADPAQLEHVIVNLAMNARDAMQEKGGTLRVFTFLRNLDGTVELGPGQRMEPGRYAVIGFEDEGCGMSPEVRSRVFEPFFTTKSRGHTGGTGTGLGLSSAYGITRQSGGGIEVESQEGRGSRFFVHLPALATSGSAPPSGNGAGARHRRAAADGGTILLVEDDVQVTDMTRRILQRAGFEVIAAHRPDDALVLSEDHPGELDLLISDVVMPGGDGPHLARRIREHRPHIPVLYISGHTPELVARKDAAAGGDVLLPKPFTADQLLNRIHQVLEAGRGAAGRSTG